MFYVFIIIIIICIVLSLANSMLDFTLHTSNVSQPPVKNCMKPCPRNISYVCGSDGITYVNPCAFDIADCKAGGKLESKPGECPDTILF